MSILPSRTLGFPQRQATPFTNYVHEIRMAAVLFVPAAGEAQDRKKAENTDDVFRFDLRPTKARITKNNYSQADECEVTFAYDEAGLDPRYLRSGELYIHVQDSAAFGGFTPDQSNLRFLGIVRDVERNFSDQGDKTITVSAQDYTCLFLESKSFPPSGVPAFTDTITTAWQKICDHTGYWDLDSDPPVVNSTVENLKDKLEFQGDIDPNTPLGKAMPARLAKLGKVQLLSGTSDAWAVWQACIQPLGLISFIRGDRCIVSTATDFYTGDDPPAFLWGLNILELSESRRLGQLSAKNICLRSYDPLAGHILESLYPKASLALKRKRLGAAPPKKPRTSLHTQDYECIDLPFPVADQAVLDSLAQRVWEERTRQELAGRLKTREMFAATANGTQSAFDLLTLEAGDQIQVDIDRGALDSIQSLFTVGEREKALRYKGYSEDTARFIAANINSIDKLPSQFLVKSVTTDIEVTSASGGCSYDLEIEFLNRIDITAGGTVEIGAGSATNQAQGKNAPPVSGQSTDPAKKRPGK